MKCPCCNNDARIVSAATVVEGDRDTGIVVYIEQVLECVNPQCADKGKQVAVVRHRIN